MTNVVKLKSKNKPASPVSSKASDARLIESCITYAQSMAAYTASFRASPDDTYSDKTSGRAYSRAKAALRSASGKATTAGGLNAKARIVPIIIDDAYGSAFEQEQLKFISSFAADVKVYLQPRVDEEWQVRNFGAGNAS